jgi:hypothetical protein
VAVDGRPKRCGHFEPNSATPTTTGGAEARVRPRSVELTHAVRTRWRWFAEAPGSRRWCRALPKRERKCAVSRPSGATWPEKIASGVRAHGATGRWGNPRRTANRRQEPPSSLAFGPRRIKPVVRSRMAHRASVRRRVGISHNFTAGMHRWQEARALGG